MVRLTDKEDSLNADIMDKLSDRKRSRPDSLKYKNNGDQNIVTPKTTDKTKTKPQMEDYTTDANTGSPKDGIPRTGFSSFSEDEIRRAIRKPGKVDPFQKQEIPIVQWVIIFIALGLGAFYLKKSLTGGSTSSRSSKKKALVEHDTSQLEEVIKELVEDNNHSKSVVKKSLAKKKKSKQKTVTTGKTKVEAHIMGKTNATTKTTTAPQTMTSGKEVVLPPSTTSDEDAGEWQTVGVVKKTPSEGSTHINGTQSVLTNDTALSVDNSKKPKKKKKKIDAKDDETQTAKASVTTATGPQPDDAALARELQNEENGIAPVTHRVTEDVWEEVGTKKKGKRKE